MNEVGIETFGGSAATEGAPGAAAGKTPGGESLRVVLLGFGRLARGAHGPVLARLPGVSLVAVADESEAALGIARERVPKASLYRDFLEPLNALSIDAAVICLPPHLHARAAEACLARGVHVYVEKPLAHSLAAGERVLRAWRESGAVGWTGFNFRFHPLVRRMRDEVAAGRVGRVVGVQAAFASAHRDLPAWKRGPETGGGVQLDLDSHHVDLLRFVLGQEVAAVSATTASVSSEADTSVTQLELTGGTLATLFSSLAAVERHTVEVLGDAGQLVFDRYRSSRLRYTPARRDFGLPARLRGLLAEAARFPRVARDALRPPREGSYERALTGFFEAVRGGSATGPDLRDGFESLRVVDAAARSAETAERVRLPVVRG